MGAGLAVVSAEDGDGDGGGGIQLWNCGHCGGIIFKVYVDNTGTCVQCDSEDSFANDNDAD